MTDDEVLAALDDRQTLGLTMWAEARGVPRDDPNDHSPVEELIAVAQVVMNRRPHFTRWSATAPTVKAICLAPRQFSCWLPGSGANHDALMARARELASATRFSTTDPILRECLYLADGVISGALLDRTGSADSYWAPAAMVPPGRVPSWARGAIALQQGTQLFVRIT